MHKQFVGDSVWVAVEGDKIHLWLGYNKHEPDRTYRHFVLTPEDYEMLKLWHLCNGRLFPERCESPSGMTLVSNPHGYPGFYVDQEPSDSTGHIWLTKKTCDVIARIVEAANEEVFVMTNFVFSILK